MGSPAICPGCALLAALGDGFLDADGPATPTPGRLREGQLAGRFRIVSYLASGGAGEVYLAEQQGEVSLRAAVKVMRAPSDSDRMVVRFEAERAALMRMDHPGVAKVLDAGFLLDGRPYVAMEWVQGGMLGDYVREKQLPLTERLTLFRKICAAVQHAHQKGIVHRDLKPSNILIAEHDGAPEPKLIDFGIARALDRPETLEALYTRQAEILGTPAYMSPEQTLGGKADIDVRADVYALGLMLYELLTDGLPVSPDALHAMALDDALRTIREKEAPAPSSRCPGLDRDLDAVTLKALAKEPERRYQSALALSEDVERYLRQEPVTATTPTTAYRLSKFVRRNRGLVAAGAAVLGAIVMGAIVSVHQARQARKAEAVATERLADSEELIRFMVGDLYLQLRPIGKLDALGGTAEKVEAFYKKLGNDGRGLDSLVAQARAFMQLGRVRSAQGHAEQAESNFATGIAILDRALIDSPGAENATDLLVNLWDSLASHRLRAGQHAESAIAFDNAIAITDAQIAREPAKPLWKDIAIDLLINRSALASGQDRQEEALAYSQKAGTLTGPNTKAESRIVIQQNTGHAAMKLGDLDTAEAANTEAIRLQREDLLRKPDNTQGLDRLAWLMTNQSAVLYRRGETAALLAMNRDLITQREKLLAIEPTNVYWRDALASAWDNLSLALSASGDADGALDAARRAVATRTPLATAEPANPAWRKAYLDDVVRLEILLASIGRWEENYAVRLHSHPIDPDPRSSSLALGRAASRLALSAAGAEDRLDYLAIANLAAKSIAATPAELAAALWPMEKLEGLGAEPDLARLNESLKAGRIAVPKAWLDAPSLPQ